MSDFVDRWLYHDQTDKIPPPDALHPADEFPLATISNPPSSTASSDDGRLHVSRADIVNLLHPPTPNMEDFPTNQTRRRSASLAGATNTTQGVGNASKKHQRTQSGHISEADEDRRSSDDEHSGSSGDEGSTDLELDDMRSDEGLEDDEETGLTARDRRRRRRRKRRNTRLDQRIMEDAQITKEEEKIATQSMVQSMLVNALLIGLW